MNKDIEREQKDGVREQSVSVSTVDISQENSQVLNRRKALKRIFGMVAVVGTPALTSCTGSSYSDYSNYANTYSNLYANVYTNYTVSYANTYTNYTVSYSNTVYTNYTVSYANVYTNYTVSYSNTVYTNYTVTYANVYTNYTVYSDRRLKTNIHRIGTHKLGVGIYEFDYVWGEHKVGVMADEIEKVLPEAVVTHASGFKMVNYSLLQ